MFTGEPVIVDDSAVFVPQFLYVKPKILGINSTFNPDKNLHIFMLDIDFKPETNKHTRDFWLNKIVNLISAMHEGLTIVLSTGNGNHIVNFTPVEWTDVKISWFHLLHHFYDDYICINFIMNSIRRGYSTLRIGPKDNRNIEFVKMVYRTAYNEVRISLNHYLMYKQLIPEVNQIKLTSETRIDWLKMKPEHLKDLLVEY